MFALENQELNGVKIVKWNPDERPDRVMYHKIETNLPSLAESFDSLKAQFDALPELTVANSWGYWDMLVKAKADIDFVAYNQGRGNKIEYYLMGPSAKSYKRK